MITAHGSERRYQVTYSSKDQEAIDDAGKENGGGGAGFRPHELLEAALGTCMAITIRMYADRKQIPLENVTVHVEVDHPGGESVFRYDVQLSGESLTEEQRARLMKIARSCPVHKTLAGPIRFEDTSSVGTVPPPDASASLTY